MPLTKDVGANIRELEQHGTRPRSMKQIVAIALHASGKKKRKASEAAKSGATRR